MSATLARHICHCLKLNDPCEVEKAFRRSPLSPASEEDWSDLRASLEERFEAMEATLCQIERQAFVYVTFGAHPIT